MSLAIEFDQQVDRIDLLYSPRDDSQWVEYKFKKGEPLIIKGTYHLTSDDLVPSELSADASAPGDESNWEPMRFKLGRRVGDYYEIYEHILQVGFPVFIHIDCSITWKWFTSPRRVSIFRVIAALEPAAIYIGGDAADAIPAPEFEKLIARFPTDHEIRRYTEARVGAVIRNYTETKRDTETLYNQYIEKRLVAEPKPYRNEFAENEIIKFETLHDSLIHMLNDELNVSESQWQEQILKIVCLLNPRYIQPLEHVTIHDSSTPSNRRQIDILLVDASGNVDIIEIKKPFGKSILSQATYRDNHIPLRELSGSVMQVEKYIYYLNRWGEDGEKKLTKKYGNQLPHGFSIKITNPTGIIIIGRDSDLTEKQRTDFEFVKRKYKSIVDIITYDDLLRRLRFVVDQLKASPSALK